MKKFFRNLFYFTWIVLAILLSGNTFAQRSISGRIVDSVNGESLPGVTIVVSGTTTGTVSNIDGDYHINVPYDSKQLEFSMIGFEKQIVTLGVEDVINVSMKTKTTALDEVVITGYSTQSRAEMTTSVAKLDTKVLESVPRSNAATALQGTIAGLKVTQTTGQPGSTPSLVVRGGTSFDGTGNPLVLIDGVPGSFYALNSDDIESMEVLKDAASTAIYGARAANGVILVTTKKGKAGKSNINFRAKFTSNQRRDDPMEYLGAADYVKFNRLGVRAAQDVMGYPWLDVFLTGGQAAATGNNTTNSIYTTMVLTDENKYLLNYDGWQTLEDPVNPGTTLLFMENQMNELFYQDSWSQDYSLSFDGGNDRGTYYLGLGYMDDNGLVFGSSFERVSGSFNASYKIKENLKVSSNLIYSHSKRNLPYDSEYNLFQRTAGLAPTSRIYNNNPDGSLSSEYQPGTYLGFGNPLYYRDKFIRNNLEERLTGSVQFDYKFLNDFNLTVRGSHFSVNNSNESFDKAYLNSGSLRTERKASASHTRTLRDQITAMLNYKKSFKEHNVSALVGTEYFKEKYFTFNAATRLSPTDLIYTMNVGSEASGVPYSYKTGYEITSLFGQVNYDFDYKYLFGFTFRYDGTSRLGNNKYDFFPGVSAGWNIHNEDFFSKSKIKSTISKIKPRLSYGVNGNIDVLSNFGVFGTYAKSNIYDTQSGYANTQLPLLDLKWERSTTFNMGADVGFYKDRITLIADYFIREVKDKLAGLTLPLWTGFSSITTNNGTLQNRGLELQVNADVIKTSDFNWNVGLNYYSVKNYAKSLPENGVENNRQGGTEIYDPKTGETKYVGGLQEGERVGLDLITGYVFDGVYQTQADIDEHAGRVVEFATKKDVRFLGDTRWKDLNGDNVINYLDRVVIGRRTPDFTGGFTTELNYKNFSLFMKSDFAIGHYIINGRRVKGIAQTQGNQNGPAEIADSWTPENPTSDVPIFTLVDRQRNHLAAGGDQGSMSSSSSRMWEKGDYLALREVTLSYDLDAKIAKNVFQNVRLYLSGSNLAYFNGFSGSSPEESSSGLDTGRFPLPRTYTLGLHVTF
ncbi:SusC/RagA family TonB-linked outer membrane protein [Prolixibacteraceae bacterium Z1-6]|uniref:SusC/RagA family TonB-linked outer membrane protein n=1 Tax=Draconibacterium aestuarii TaxID=2998507 RepID=A0A9X3J685_9BACT|nr:SusC/RagA family TonB-linked outer membrane protein [Prolixibacteraceae bacterium Z1-6]